MNSTENLRRHIDSMTGSLFRRRNRRWGGSL